MTNREDSARVGAVWIKFLYDIVLLAESAADLQKLLKALHEYLDRWRLWANMDKTRLVGIPGYL